MKLYIKEAANLNVILISETGEELWQFNDLSEAMKTCREFSYLSHLPVPETLNSSNQLLA